jgi:pimeloyl-ACP methyl ester carboxylesterase
MSEAVVKTSYIETPVFFDVGQDTLFGLVTLPRNGTARTGLIILSGAGTPITVNRNRMSVRICRELAARGYAGFRLDYHGVGDSTGFIDEFRLDRPFVDDVTAAVECLRGLGVERVILAGSCFGARTALSAAVQLDNVDAVILVASALRDYALGERKSLNQARNWSLARYIGEALRPSRLKGLFHRRTRRVYATFARGKLRVMVSKVPGVGRLFSLKPTATEDVAPSFEQPLRTLVERGVAVQFIYGAEDGFYTDEYRTAAAGPLADVLGEERGAVGVSVLPGRLHGFTTVATQDAVIEEIIGWTTERRPGNGRAPSGDPT